MTKTELNPNALTVIGNIRSLLQYHLSSGIESYPASNDISSLLQITVSARTENRFSRSVTHGEKPTEQSVRPIEPKMPKAVRTQMPQASLEDIRGEVETCTGCSLSEKRIVPVAGRGGEKVRLLIVGDWLSLANGQQPPTGCIFGVEQDRMLDKMIDAIQLPRNEAFVANVIKCGISANCQPKAEHVHACLSFLQRQVSVLQPEVILAMGMIATRALLNRREPLSRLRGRVHTCVTPDGRKIPLIATYHPTFLLQNPEMKKATWVDLQMLAKTLATPDSPV